MIPNYWLKLCLVRWTLLMRSTFVVCLGVMLLAGACVLYVRAIAQLLGIHPAAAVAIAAELPTIETTITGTDEPPPPPFGAGFVPHDRLAKYTAQPGRHSMVRAAGTDNDLGGVSHVSPSTVIHWRAEYRIDSEGASVAAVLEAVAVRLSAIQNTPQASDANARALWEVIKALEVLEGLEAK